MNGIRQLYKIIWQKLTEQIEKRQRQDDPFFLLSTG